MSALFANLVIQNTNMALIFLGKVPHPETGKTELELETARIFIDQLEMLEVKTKGNLSKNEEALLKQNLTSLRMAFVEAVSHQPQAEAPGKGTPGPQPAPTPPAGEGEKKPAPEPAAPAPEPESHKRFSKKY